MLNVSRILSKISMDSECSRAIIQTKKLNFLVDMLVEWQTYTPFVARISFVLANLTTYFEEAREQIGTPEHVTKIIKVALAYFERDENL